MGLDTDLIRSDERHHGPFCCVICQQLVDLDALVTTRCSHVYCRSCLPVWLLKSHMCPTCNQDLLYSSTSNSNSRQHYSSMQIGEHSVLVQRLEVSQPLAHRLLQRILVECPLGKQRGVSCSWTGDYADLQAHLLSSTAHAATAEVSSGKAKQQQQPDSDIPAQMEVNGVNEDFDSMSQQRQRALALAASLKEEANGKFQSKRYEDARSLYGKAIAVLQEIDDNSKERTNLTQQSSSSSQQEDEDEQQQRVTDLLSTLYSNRAATDLQLNNYHNCLEDCQVVIRRLDPTNHKVYVRACRAAIQLGNLQQAESIALQHSQHCSKGPSQRRSGASLIAKELNHIRQLKGDESKAQEELRKQNYADAKSCYGNLLRTAPSAVPFLLGAARADLGLGLTDSALRLTKSVLMKHPQSPIGCWVRGQTLFLMEEFAMGLKLMQEALRLDPDSSEIRTSYRSFKKIKEWVELAKQEMFQRKFIDAVDNLTFCVDEFASNASLPPKSPLFATIYTQRAEAYFRSKNYPNVLKDCAVVVYAQEDHIPAWLIRFQALHGMDEHETAMEEIQTLLRRFEQDDRLRKAYEKADFLLRKKRRVDYYELLGVSSIASAMEIKKAYKKKSLEYHPDRIPVTASEKEKQEAQRNFQLLGEGLEILCDDFQRKLYDEGYDPAAIRERVEAANQAAHRHRSHRGGGHFHPGHHYY